MTRFKDLRFVVLVIENLGVKLKLWLFMVCRTRLLSCS